MFTIVIVADPPMSNLAAPATSRRADRDVDADTEPPTFGARRRCAVDINPGPDAEYRRQRS
jgi:hypothetical protein